MKPSKVRNNAKGHKCWCGNAAAKFDHITNTWVCGHHCGRNYYGEDLPHKSEGSQSLDKF